MRGLIITNQEIRHNQYKIDRFVEEFSKRNIPIDVRINDGSLAYIKNNQIVLNIPQYDFVIYVDKDNYLAKLLEKAGLRLFDKADFIKMCDDKMLTFIACSNAGIKMPDTFAGPLVYTTNEHPDLTLLDKVINELGLPVVIKKVYGSLGEGVYLAKTKEELIKLYLEICHNPILFQKYVKSEYGKSIRVLIIDGKVFGMFERRNLCDFRSNYGDKATSAKILKTEKYAEIALKIADKFQIEYAGLDFLDDGDEPLLCEINSNAFFEEFEKVTGLDVAEAYADMVIKKVKINE